MIRNLWLFNSPRTTYSREWKCTPNIWRTNIFLENSFLWDLIYTYESNGLSLVTLISSPSSILAVSMARSMMPGAKEAFWQGKVVIFCKDQPTLLQPVSGHTQTHHHPALAAKQQLTVDMSFATCVTAYLTYFGKQVSLEQGFFAGIEKIEGCTQ